MRFVLKKKLRDGLVFSIWTKSEAKLMDLYSLHMHVVECGIFLY